MAEEKVTITGKSREEIAYDLLIFAFNKSIRPFDKDEPFKNYEEFLGQYQKALRAVFAPNTKVTDLE